MNEWGSRTNLFECFTQIKVKMLKTWQRLQKTKYNLENKLFFFACIILEHLKWKKIILSWFIVWKKLTFDIIYIYCFIELVLFWNIIMTKIWILVGKCVSQRLTLFTDFISPSRGTLKEKHLVSDYKFTVFLCCEGKVQIISRTKTVAMKN